MATNEFDYDLSALLGNATIPRNSFPMIRASKRRTDPDGVSNIPYFSGITGKKLDIEYTDSSLVVQTVSLTIAGTGYAALIAAITALDATNIEALDLDGFLAIRNVNAGETHYIKILPQSVTGDEAAGLLGLAVDPLPGSVSYAGEISSSPGHRSQKNPQGTALLSRGEDLTSDSVNRALASILRSVEKLKADLERDTIRYVDVVVTVQQHEISTGFYGYYLNDPTIRLPTKGVSPSTDFGFQEGYFTLLDTIRKEEVSVNGEKVQGIRAHHADATTAISTSTGFVTWDTPNGGHIYDSSIPLLNKHASVAISTIVGNVLYCPGAQFETKFVQKNDPVLISGASNTSPFSHNGWFMVQEVIDEEHLRLRPASSGEVDTVRSTEAIPAALNPTGSGFGNLVVKFGDFVPARKMFVVLRNGPSVTPGVYIARIACGKPVKDAVISRPFHHSGDPSQVGRAFYDHINDFTAAHAASSIGGFTSTTAWKDTSTITGADLQATIENILTDLAAVTTSASGSGRIGAEAVAVSGGSFNLYTGDSRDILAGSIYSQLWDLLWKLRDHEVDSNRHDAYGVLSSGFNNTGSSGLNFTVSAGNVLANGRYWSYGGSTLALTNNVTNFVYLDGTDGLVKVSASTASFSDTAVPLWQVSTFSGAIVANGITDMRRYLVPSRKRGILTVGSSGCDFATIEGALAYVGHNITAGESRIPEIVIQGSVTMTKQVTLNHPVIIRGVAVDGADANPRSRITTVAGGPSFTAVDTGLSNVVFRDLYFNCPTGTPSSTQSVIKIDGTGVGDNWLIENCVFAFGTNGPHIYVDPSNTPRNWKIRNCTFNQATRTAPAFHIAIADLSNFAIDNCRFFGSSANTDHSGISLFTAGSEVDITNCTFDMGGRHIAVGGTWDAVKVANCRFKNSRESSINLLSTGEVEIENSRFTGCMSASSTSAGVIWADSGATTFIRGCRFKNWGSGYAIRALGNTYSNSRVVDNVFTATAVNQAVIGFQHALFQGNDFDLLPGAGSGSGHDISVVLSTLGYNRIVNNFFRNCGSTATSGSDTVIAFNDHCVVTGNNFLNCRGTLIQINGDGCVVSGNVTDDIGAASTDIGVAVSGFNCVVNGNVFEHATSALPVQVNGNDYDAHVHGNAVSRAMDTSISVGLTGNSVYKRHFVSIGSKSMVPSTQLHAYVPMSPDTYGIHKPELIIFPPKVGFLEPGVRFFYNNGTFEDCFNTSGSFVEMRFPADTLPGGLTSNIPTSDEVAINAIAIMVRNVGGASDTQTLGQFRYRGYVVG